MSGDNVTFHRHGMHGGADIGSVVGAAKNEHADSDKCNEQHGIADWRCEEFE